MTHTPTKDELDRLDEAYAEYKAELKDLNDIISDQTAVLVAHRMHVKRALERYEAYAECIGLPQQLIA